MNLDKAKLASTTSLFSSHSSCTFPPFLFFSLTSTLISSLSPSRSLLQKMVCKLLIWNLEIIFQWNRWQKYYVSNEKTWLNQLHHDEITLKIIALNPVETLPALRMCRWEVSGMSLWYWCPEQATLNFSTTFSYFRAVLHMFHTALSSLTWLSLYFEAMQPLSPCWKMKPLPCLPVMRVQ